MVIWLYAIFSNEAALLPFFLRHYGPLCDRLILYDNASTDHGAALIDKQFNAEVRRYPAERAVMDSVKAAQFASDTIREARGQADYVIWMDCDEFLWCGSVLLRELLRGYRTQGIRAIKTQGYQMLSDHFPAGDAPITSQIHYGLRDSEYDKVCIIDPNLDIQWRPGRHVCNVAQNVLIYQSDIRLLHYRFLGMDFFKQRNAYNEANRSEAERAAGRSYHMAADHQGKYSLAWYQQAMAYRSDVVNLEWIGV